MNIEILASRGETVTSLEFSDLGMVRLIVQMGTPENDLKKHLDGALKPEVSSRFISLWSNPDHPREFVELGRNLLIRDCA